MAKGSTVYKAELGISDIDRGYYAQHTLTLALHPSETEQRLMVRLLAFVLHAGPALAFGRGLSTDDEPDLWARTPTGEIALWIDIGLPDLRAVRKACGRAARVVVLAYGERRAAVWWRENAAEFARCRNLTVQLLPDADAAALAALAARSMALTATLQNGRVWLASDATAVECAVRPMADSG
jgi:uncharacterized protein YaeQ